MAIIRINGNKNHRIAILNSDDDLCDVTSLTSPRVADPQAWVARGVEIRVGPETAGKIKCPPIFTRKPS